jgi:phosphoserine phosphatase
VHHQTGLAEFQKGMAELKKKLDSLDSSEQETKAKLIVANFDSFLAAKQVLDRINSRFLESDETKKQLEQLEQGLQHLKSRTKQQIVPLSEFLQDIKDCAHSTEGVRYVALLLSLNREVTLALLQEDNV